MSDKSYSCPGCGTEQEMVRHDTPETWVRCNQCGYRYQIKEGLYFYADIQRVMDAIRDGSLEYAEMLNILVKAGMLESHAESLLDRLIDQWRDE